MRFQSLFFAYLIRFCFLAMDRTIPIRLLVASTAFSCGRLSVK